jgi:hypothetical protein
LKSAMAGAFFAVDFFFGGAATDAAEITTRSREK